MSQHDYDLANGSGAAFRADINSVLGAIASENSGASAPTTTFAYMFWADTTTGLMKQRNAANSAWITLWTLSSGAMPFTPSGNIAATNVPAAIAELDSEKVAKTGDTVSGDLKVAGLNATVSGSFSIPATMWTGEHGVWLTGLGYIGTQGSFRSDWVYNGYRNNSAGWTSLNINSSTAASVISMGPGDIRFYTDPSTPAGTMPTQRGYLGIGFVMGSPTGGDKGAGTINAAAVYDDNTLLTCMAASKEFLETGTVDLAFWDAQVPDLVIPAREENNPVYWEVIDDVTEFTTTNKNGRLVRKKVTTKRTKRVEAFISEPIYDEKTNKIVDDVKTYLTETITIPEQRSKRIHRTARIFKTMIESGFDPREPEQFFDKWKAEQAIPGMPTRDNWKHGELSSGEMISQTWLAMEILTIVNHAMWLKIKDHETRLEALEAK